MLRAIAAGVVMFIAGSANAETTPQECAAISDSLQRLTCFDKLFPKGDVKTNEETETSETSNWEIKEERSPIDDSLRVTAFLLPRDAEKKSRIFGGESILVRCRDNTTSVIYTTGQFGIRERIKVTYRLGTDTPKTESWNGSSDRQAAGLWDGSKAIPFLKQLKNNETLAMQTEEPRTEAVFDLGDVETIVAKISDACNWK